MNIIVLASIKTIFNLKHEHHHLVKAIPRGVHPLECYKYKNNRAIRIPCNEIPEAEDTTSSTLHNKEYVDKHGRPVYLNDNSFNSYRYLNKRKHKKYGKLKSNSIDQIDGNVPKQIMRISRKLKGLSNDEKNLNREDQSSSICSSSSNEEKQRPMNSFIENKLKGINKSLYDKFIRALKRFKKKYKNKRSHDLQRILAFIVGMENRKFQENFLNKKPTSLSSFKKSTKQSSLIPICEIEKSSTNMGNEFQKTIEGLLSHISDLSLDNIFSQWGEISKKTKSKKNNLKKLSSDENKSLVESLNSRLGTLKDNSSDAEDYPGCFENQNKMISLLTSSNTGYPLIPPSGYSITPTNYSPLPANYSQVLPSNYPPPFPPISPQPQPTAPLPFPLTQPLQLNYTPPMKYPSPTQFGNQSPIYPMDCQKPSIMGTNLQNITPQEILSSVYTNFNNISPLYVKP